MQAPCAWYESESRTHEIRQIDIEGQRLNQSLLAVVAAHDKLESLEVSYPLLRAPILEVNGPPAACSACTIAVPPMC